MQARDKLKLEWWRRRKPHSASKPLYMRPFLIAGLERDPMLAQPEDSGRGIDGQPLRIAVPIAPVLGQRPNSNVRAGAVSGGQVTPSGRASRSRTSFFSQ